MEREKLAGNRRASLGGQLLFITALSITAMHCSSGDGSEGTAGPKPGHGQPDGPHTVEGKLIHKPYNPSVRSKQSYTGAEFFMEDPHYFSSGAPFPENPIVILPSDAVPAEELKAKKDTRVTLTVEYDPGRKPSGGNFIVGPDGEPLPQGSGWRALGMVEMPGKP